MYRWGYDSDSDDEELDVAKIWQDEEKLSKRKRRARYSCRRFYTIKNLNPWTIDMVRIIPDIHTVKIIDPTTDSTTSTNTAPTTNSEQQPIQNNNTQDVQKNNSEEKPNTNEEKKENQVEGEKKADEKSTSDASEKSSNDTENKLPSIEQLTANIQALKIAKSRSPSVVYLESKKDGPFTPNKEINRKITLWQGNICTLEIDAIVNAANRSLLGGGGIDGAIHDAAGRRLVAECRTLNGCSTGKTKITRGYDLPAKYVLHAVGPVGEDPVKLESCYLTVLDLVVKHNIKHVALCGISTGIYGYPLIDASKVACHTVRKWLEVEENRNKVDRIIVCTFLDKEQACYEKLFQEYFPPCEDKAFYDEYLIQKKKWEDEESEDEESEEEEEEEKKEEVKNEEKKEEGTATSESGAGAGAGGSEEKVEEVVVKNDEKKEGDKNEENKVEEKKIEGN